MSREQKSKIRRSFQACKLDFPETLTECLRENFHKFLGLFVFKNNRKKFLLCDFSHENIKGPKYSFQVPFGPISPNATTLLGTNAVIIVILVCFWIQHTSKRKYEMYLVSIV